MTYIPEVIKEQGKKQKLIYLKCKNCRKAIYSDQENDWVHLHPAHLDSRLCKSGEDIASPFIEGL